MSNYGDQFMECPECGGRAESDAVDVGVGLYIAGNYWCECGWEIGADGKMNVATYDDYFIDFDEVEVFNILALPHGCTNTVTTPNKTEIMKRLADNQNVPGARIKTGEATLMVRAA